MSQLSSSVPPMPCKSIDSVAESTPSPRRSGRIRRSLQQVVSDLSAQGSELEETGTMLTVPDLDCSQFRLNIPVLDQPEPSPSSARTEEPSAGPSGLHQSAVSAETPSSGVQLILPSELPPLTCTIVPRTAETAVQTDLHIEESDVVVVVPRQGGRLSLI